MKHLSLDERVALAEAPGEPSHPHLAVCAGCRDTVAAVRARLREAKSVEVPDPSPLFWEHFSARVSAGLDNAPVAPAGWRIPWRVLVPLAVGAMGLVLAVSIHRGDRPVPAGASAPVVVSAGNTAVADGGAGADDDAWTVLQDVASDFDVDTLGDSLGHPISGSAEAAVWNLSDDERAELGRLLGAELGSGRIRSE
jgi:hypothetical protein